ncbi:MAG TPA: phosphatidylglycerol lysyltransferase domain-containing protein, partial [Negativicutes bacterium]
MFDGFFRQRKYENSHFNFTNLFMWRKIYAIEWTVEDDVLWVKASWEGNTFMLPPFAPSMAPVGRTIDKVIAYFALNGWPFEIRGMENDIKSWFEELKPGYFNYE